MRFLKLLDLVNEFNYFVSMILRVIFNKYLVCERGVFFIKYFFSIVLDNSEILNVVIKDYFLELIKNEDKKEFLSDVKILEFIEEKFCLKMVRRMIIKYC